MDEYPITRPSKRRKVLAEDEPLSASDSQQTTRSTRSSTRYKRANIDDGHAAQNGNRAEEEAPTRRSTRLRSKKAEFAVAADVASQANGTVSAPAQRSSGRLRAKAENLENGSAPEGRVIPKKAKQSDTSKLLKTSKGTGRVDAGRSRATRSKPRSSSTREQDKTVWDVPTSSDEHEAEAEDTLEGETVDHSPGGTDGRSYEDRSDAATQLQQELHNSEQPVSEPKELPNYARTLKELCEKNGYCEMVTSLGQFVLDKLCGKRPIPLRALHSEYLSVYQLLEQTVVAGEGNSMLILGGRGCGKTALVESAISSLAEHHRDEFHVVRLNGFLHTDDKIAVREIWHQLGREAGNDDEEPNKPSSYADTMATLLALLSHPDELFGPSEDANALVTTKSVIIVLDEFDLFSHHPRQTLLYNLFDIAQARKAPLAVLGLTTKVDVTENLEKRVKSRFSHRHVFLPRPRSFEEFSDICLAALKVEESELVKVSVSPQEKTIAQTDQGKKFLQGWNTYVEDLIKDPSLQNLLRQIFYRTRCPKDFFASALIPLSSLFLDSQNGTLEIPTAESFASNTLSCPDPPPLPLSIPSNVSTSTISLPLSLLLTATRLTALHDPGLSASNAHASGTFTLSFATVYAEYVRLLTSAKASASASGAAATPGRIWGKDAAREAWEKLVDWGLVVPVSADVGIGDAKMFRVEISFEEVVEAMGQEGSGALGRWWRDT
ncbi:hypothetical protein VTO42DRAFT_2315 [Malbranchea cinnamomea]